MQPLRFVEYMVSFACLCHKSVKHFAHTSYTARLQLGNFHHSTRWMLQDAPRVPLGVMVLSVIEHCQTQ